MTAIHYGKNRLAILIQKRNRCRRGLFITLLLMALLLSGGMNIAQATSPVPYIDLTHPNTTGTFYTNEVMSLYVGIDGSSTLQGTIMSGAYVDISGPAKYLKNISVNPMAFTKSIESFVSADGKTLTTRVYLVDFDNSMKGSFPYTAEFKDRITPEGYVWKPEVNIYHADGTLMDEQKPSEVATLTTKVMYPSLFKYHTAMTAASFRTDGGDVYGGQVLDTGNGLVIDPNNTADVVFAYKTNTASDTNDRIWTGDGWMELSPRSRLIDKIVITDKLPQYTDLNGVVRTAVFSQENGKNSGWVDNGDGTVSYTVEALKNADGSYVVVNNVPQDAQEVLSTVKLLLNFPDIPVTYDDLLRSNVSALVTNNVYMDLYPVNANDGTSVNEIRSGKLTGNATVDAQTTRFRDSLSIKLRTTLLPAAGYATKTVTDLRTPYIDVDHGAMHIKSATYVVTVHNPTPFTMTNIVITEEGFDNRLFIKNIRSAAIWTA